METLRRSTIFTTVVTANGEVETQEEAQVYVHDLDLFVTVQILDDTPAVLSLGKLCEEHGYTSEWASGQKSHLTKQGKKIPCKTENFVPLVVSGLSSNSGTSSSSTSPPQDSSSTSSSPASERSDDPAPGNWRDSPGAQNKAEKRDNDCQEEFAENLHDTEVLAPAHLSHDSDPERPMKVAQRKHIFLNSLLEKTEIAKYACEPR